MDTTHHQPPVAMGCFSQFGSLIFAMPQQAGAAKNNMTPDNTPVYQAEYMQRCLELAQLAHGHTAPNPMVGAVLVHDGRIIAEGWHQQYGGPHAEINCLDNVLPADRHLIPASTLYVNLEPCAHHGLTPPCALRLVQERVAHVVIANTDPYAQVSGRGIALLRQHGIPVTTGILEAEGQWLNRRFFCFHTAQRPYIVLKWAQTADGYLAPANGSRYPITGEGTQQLVHKWRTEEAAILVGTNTALLDNPQLTARLWSGKQPLRIVTDIQLRLPTTHHLMDNSTPTWILNDRREETIGNTHYLLAPTGDGLLPWLMDRLSTARITSLIVEGGAQLLGNFIAQDLWDEARVLTGPGTLHGGLPAPLLVSADMAFTCPLGADRLQLFVNHNSPYPYQPGMAL